MRQGKRGGALGLGREGGGSDVALPGGWVPGWVEMPSGRRHVEGKLRRRFWTRGN